MGGKKREREKVLRRSQSGMVTAACFISWPEGPASAVGRTHSISAANLTCPRACAPGPQGGRDPAGWQRHVLGMSCALVLTLPQAVLPDGRKIRRSQL